MLYNEATKNRLNLGDSTMPRVDCVGPDQNAGANSKQHLYGPSAQSRCKFDQGSPTE